MWSGVSSGQNDFNLTPNLRPCDSECKIIPINQNQQHIFIWYFTLSSSLGPSLLFILFKSFSETRCHCYFLIWRFRLSIFFLLLSSPYIFIDYVSFPAAWFNHPFVLMNPMVSLTQFFLISMPFCRMWYEFELSDLLIF